MKYLWIGVCLSHAQKQEIIAKGGKLLSANVSQDALVAGIEENGISLDTINGHSFPAAFKTVKEERWSRTGKSRDIGVGYRNIKYLSLHFKEKALRRAAKEWANEHQDEDVTVLIYSMHSPFLSAAAEIKKRIPKAKICLIVPDLPQFMDLHMSRLKKCLKAIDWKKIRKLMKKVDRYVLYSRHMASFLGLKDGTWTVMEGSFDTSCAIDDIPQKPEGKMPIMYSGILDLRYGIPELLDAFAELDERFELWFTGTGNAVSLIEERAKDDPRIRNFGFLPSRRDLLLKQKEAAMLISTRRSDEKASDYCFPSKLFEYMVSGNPVLSARIGGIPDEYFNYLVEMKSTSACDIRDAILSVAAMSQEEREKRGEGGRRFVLEQKNNKKQGFHIMTFSNITPPPPVTDNYFHFLSRNLAAFDGKAADSKAKRLDVCFRKTEQTAA